MNMRINAVLTEDLLKRIDEAAGEQKKSRSRFIREATEKYIAEHERKKEEQRRKEAFARGARAQDGLRKKAGKWDGASEIRKWREKAR
jgi:predicted transcriptional regulator